jgi:hypothetical protein
MCPPQCAGNPARCLLASGPIKQQTKCCALQFLVTVQNRPWLGTERAVAVTACKRLSEPRFSRNTILDDVSQAIAKARQWSCDTQTAALAHICADQLVGRKQWCLAKACRGVTDNVT